MRYAKKNLGDFLFPSVDRMVQSIPPLQCQGIMNECARLGEFIFGVKQKHKFSTYLDTKCRRVVCWQRTVVLQGILGQDADSMALPRFLASGGGGSKGNGRP